MGQNHPKVEYKTITHHMPMSQEELNRINEQSGWELISILPQPGSTKDVYYFKRPLKSEPKRKPMVRRPKERT